MRKAKQPNYRKVDSIVVIALYGDSVKFPTLQKTVHYLQRYNDPMTTPPMRHFYLKVIRSTGSILQADIPTKDEALDWLQANAE